MGGNVAEVGLAGLVFVGSHFLLSNRSFRGPMVAKMGERAFLVLYSAISILGIFWFVSAYNRAPHEELWLVETWVRVALWLLMLVACLLLIGGLSSPNPTMVGVPDSLQSRAPAVGIFAITRHPVLWAIALWALGHLMANGDVAAVLFFGWFLILALGGMAHIDSRRREAGGEVWDTLEASTSALPFGALIAGRNNWANAHISWTRIAIAAAVFVVLVLVHEWVFGVSPGPPIGWPFD